MGEPSVFVMPRFASAPNASTSVAVLFAEIGSVVPDGTATVAVLVSEPVALGEIFAVNVYVTVPPTGNDTVSLILPVPLAAQPAPLDATHDHVAPLSALGNASETVTPDTSDGPLFDATIVYVVMPPGTAAVRPSLFVTAISPLRARVSVSVAESFVDTGSVVPLGTDTVAVFTSDPVAAALTVAVSVYVAVPPTGNDTVSLILPVPLAAQLAPLDATHDHDAPLNDPGNVSATVTPDTFDGPAFDTTTVYVTDVPATSPGEPSVFVTAISPLRLSESVSVAELFPGVGSVVPLGTPTIAVFASVPVAAALTVAVSVYVAVPPTGSVTVSLILPTPLAAQLAPELATHDHDAPLSTPGNASETVPPTTADGPAFDTTIVYVTDVPATSTEEPSVFVINKSAEPTSASVSEAELSAVLVSLTPLGGVKDAMFTSEPVAEALTVPETV